MPSVGVVSITPRQAKLAMLILMFSIMGMMSVRAVVYGCEGPSCTGNAADLEASSNRGGWEAEAPPRYSNLSKHLVSVASCLNELPLYRELSQLFSSSGNTSPPEWSGIQEEESIIINDDIGIVLSLPTDP